jgi:SecD/SecF fusion protein
MSRMSRGVWIRFILVLGLLVGCAALAVNIKPNLGLDLKGGAQFVFQAEGTEQTPATAENVDKTLSVLRGRVDALGVAGSSSSCRASRATRRPRRPRTRSAARRS